MLLLLWEGLYFREDVRIQSGWSRAASALPYTMRGRKVYKLNPRSYKIHSNSLAHFCEFTQLGGRRDATDASTSSNMVRWCYSTFIKLPICLLLFLIVSLHVTLFIIRGKDRLFQEEKNERTKLILWVGIELGNRMLRVGFELESL